MYIYIYIYIHLFIYIIMCVYVYIYVFLTDWQLVASGLPEGLYMFSKVSSRVWI